MLSQQPSTASSIDIRRAIDADAPAIAAIVPQAATLLVAAERATFVLDSADGLIGVLVLAQSGDHLWIETIVIAPEKRRRGHGKTLMVFAEAAAREIGFRELEVRTTAAAPFFATQGYTTGPSGLTKRLRGGALYRATQHLEAVGVPLLKVGSAPPGRTLYYRGVWIGFALFIGLGSLSLASSSTDALTLLQIIFAATLSTICALFSLWQIWLMLAAPRSLSTMAGGLAAALVIGIMLYSKAMPQFREVMSAYRSDAGAGALQVSSDGHTLLLRGTPGRGSVAAVRGALDAGSTIREVVLEGTGDRLDPAYEIYHMIHNRRLATRVDRACASACAVMFLGGVDRSIAADAVLSFHQAGLPGLDKIQAYERNQQLEKVLTLQAGLAPSFVQRVLATPPDSVWTPTIDELLAGRVIQRVGPAREQAK